MVRGMVRVHTFIKMARSMQVSGKMVNTMAREHYPMLMESTGKASGKKTND